MLSLKLGHLVMEKTGAKVYACYIDMRPNKKDYEEFYQRLLEEGHAVRPRQGGRDHRHGPPARRKRAS